jgi:hypothetical protein
MTPRRTRVVDPRLARAYGTLAGFGFIGVAVLALPSTRLLDPLPEPQAYFLTLAAMLTGLVCLAIPWERVDPRWLHAVGLAATVEAAATVAVFGFPYVAFYFLIAVLIAYVSPDARSVGIQVGMVSLALLGPVAYGPESARSSLHVALVAIPTLLIMTFLFAYLRQKMVHDRRAYHRFAEQTLVLSSQIAGRQLGPARAHSEVEPVISLAGLHVPRPLLVAAAATVGVPLLAGGLAAAGVKLPELANESFQGVGVELPNQDEEPDEVTIPGGTNEASPSAEPARGGKAASDGQERRKGAAADEGTVEPGGQPAERSVSPALTPASEPVPGSGEPAGGGEAPVAGPEAPVDAPVAPEPLQDLLDDATKGLEDRLGQKGTGGSG